MIPNIATRRAGVLQALAAGLRAHAARHVTSGELDEIVRECRDSMKGIEQAERCDAEREAVERGAHRRAAAAMSRADAVAILNGAPGDQEVAYTAGERLRLRVDKSGVWA